MSSYHTSFSYLNNNSLNDFGLIVTHFDVDQGETDSYLTQEQIYTDSYNGNKRILYGTRLSEVAIVKITVIKQDGQAFSVTECRNIYKWLTGNPQARWLDLYAGESLQYSFLVTNQDVKPEKLDARTIGFNIYFESVSPYAYSPINTVSVPVSQSMSVNSNGVLSSTSKDVVLSVDSNGVLYNAASDDGVLITTDDGVIDPDGATRIEIHNYTDDLYNYVYLDTVITNFVGDSISIKNITTGEETTINNLSHNEVVTLTSDQFILSNKPNKTFGNTFNFVWPRMAPGFNEFVVESSGTAHIDLTYRYPIKIGDCAIDVVAYGGGTCCGDYTGDVNYDKVPWENITGTPTTIEGYGITNAYNTVEIDSKIESLDININEQDLNDMLEETLNE